MQWQNMCGNIIARTNVESASAREQLTKAVDLAFHRAQMHKFVVTSALALLAIATGKAGVARIIPYLQIGAGLVYTDVSEKESGGLVSLPVEFNLQGTLGLRFMVNQRWSIVAEGEYRHIFNAEIQKPNFGINTVGGNLGFGLFL